MFNFISRSVDYSLHSLLGFDIHKVPLEPFAQAVPSLTLVSELYTTGEALLSLTKNDNDIDTYKGQSIEDLTRDVENLLNNYDYHLKLNPLKVHWVDDLSRLLAEDQLSVLNDKYIFLENSSLTSTGDIYDFVFEIQLRNLVPVFNLPGKDPKFILSNQRLSRLEDRGCVFHIDLLSLSGQNGQEAKKITCSLLEGRLVKFVSFPIQKLEEIRKGNGIRLSKKIADLLDEQLFVNLPQL